ncbi:MAG TPA: EndoU domain-containing protein, partial [Candidatus Babeliales bacterium]|nr:EndoU domain-containing protein [Candidatus Babeliales bacterium]
GEYLTLINHADSIDLKMTAFAELKELWPWKRDHTFLTSSFVNGTGETGFIVHLDIDIMAIAERDLISSPDYVAQHANPESFKIIQEFREKCIALQQKGDRNALFQEEFKLRQELFKNGKNDNLTTNICYAIVEKIYSDSITNVLYEIAHTSSLEKAHTQLHYLEIQILDQAQQHNIILTDQIKDFIVKQYGFDVIEAGYNCYTSRPDYIKTINDQPVLSNNNISPILHNIENKSLPAAHKELTHLQKQIAGTFESLNIADTTTQKELIVKKFGIDILEQAHKKYEARSDHKILAESFIPIDVNQACATILENNNTYESVAHEMSDLAQRVFVNGHLCKLDFLPKIESYVYDSIDAMRIAQDHPTFIFNFSMVHHTLGDIQQLAHAILSGTHPTLQRSSELLVTGFTAFFKGLNPITQISNMGHLACELGSLLGKGGTALLNDPITAIHNGITTTFTLTELIRNTADFTSDLTVGKLYLSPEEYKQRTDTFCTMMGPLQGATADHCFKFVGQLAADVFATKGFGIAYTFLKEVDALEKLGKSAAAVSRIFKKGFDTHLANHPIMVTAEGIAFHMSNDLKNIGGAAKEIINSSRALIDSMTHGILAKVRQDIVALKEKFTCIEKCLPECAKKGFAEFKNGHIKIAHEHILGIEPIWNDAKNTLSGISGFHHDFMGTIEKSGLMKFVRTAEKNGCYMADIIVGEQSIPGKTFFPQHWSREEVISKLYEAYADFNKSGITPKLNDRGKYVIHGYTSEGIKIEMIIT